MCNTAEITPAGFLAYLDEERPGEAEFLVDPDCLCDDDVRLLEAKATTSGRKSGGGGEGPPDRAHACCRAFGPSRPVNASVTCAPSLAAFCAQTKALKPVMSRPTKSVWIVSVPSYV
jgi:hypothetical protein